MDVGELVARLTVDDTRYTRGMQNAGRTAQDTARTVTRAMDDQAKAAQTAAREIERSARASDQARTRSAAATDAVQTAERRLQETQRRSGATADEIATAERQLATARQNATRAADRAQAAADTYEATQRRATRTIQQHEQAQRDAARATERAGQSAQQAERDVRQLGQASEQATQQTNSLGEGLRGRLENAFGGVGEIAGRSGDSGAGNFLASFSGRVAALGTKAGPIGAALAGIAAIGLGAGVILANAIADGMEQEASQDLIQAKLGINEATAGKIGKASGAAYANNFGESVQSNMDGIAALIQAGVLTGEEDTPILQKSVEQLNTVSQLMGEELPAVARAVGKSMQNGIAKDATGAFDLLTKSQQGSLNVSEDLLESQVEYSTQLRALGLDGTEGWGLVSQGVKNGARDTDVVIDALKEFKLRASDGTAAAADGFDKLGVSAEDFQSAMVEGSTASRDMMATMLRNLHEIKDPQDRYNAALALFGTKFEDIQGAVDSMNLDTAAQEFGKVEGAAQAASDVIGSNTAASFETAKRSFEQSSADIKLALAQAFGPALQDAANWITEHKPELIAFFTGLADAGFATLDAMMAFTSGSLRAWAFFAEGVGGTIGGIVQKLAGLVDAQASVLDLIPGMGGQADDFRGIADSMYGFADSVGTAGDKARAMADVIDKGRPVIQGMRDTVAEAGAQAESSARLMQALGKTVVEDIPDNKTIQISDNSPETVKNLEALGLKVETTPNGIMVTAKTAEADRILNDFIHQERGITLDVYPTIQAARTARGVSPDFVGPVNQVIQNADGGIHDPGQANIRQGQGRGIYQWAENETGWEAFIPGAPSKRAQSEKILAETAKRFGLGLVKPMADGGITGGIGKDGLDASMAWARSMDPATYLMGGFSTDSIDCSGAVSGAINKALGLDAFDSRMSTVSEGSWLQAKGAILGKGPEGSLRVGWWDQGGGANGHTALTYPDGTNFESNGSEGVVVGGPTGADDPSFDQQAWFPMSGDLGQSSSGSGAGTAGSDGGGVASGTTSNGASVSTDGQRVFVTNWPGSSSSSSVTGGSTSTGASTPAPADPKSDTIFSAAIKYRANGGIDNLPDQAGIQHGTVYRYGEPETGGEGFIPLAPSKRGRSVAITRQIANRFGYQLVPMADGGLGGFGGYTGNSDRPSLDIPLTAGGLAGMTANQRRAAMYNLGAIGVGGAFAVASGFDENGNFTGQFDTGANSHPALEKGVSAITDILDQILAAAKEGKNVNVKVDVDQGSGMANLAITKMGL